MALTDFTIVRRSIFGRLFSSVVTVITVAVAVALMLVLISMRHSGRQAFERGSGNMHLLVSRDASPLAAVLNGVFYANPPQRSIKWSEYLDLTAKFPLEWAIPTQIGDSWRGYSVLATTTEFFSRFEPVVGEPWKFAIGKPFDRELQIVVGAAVARETGVKIGEKIVLTHGVSLSDTAREAMLASGRPIAEPHVHTEYKFEVVGILEPSASPHDRALFMSLESTWILHGHDRRVAENAEAPLMTVGEIEEVDRLITGIYLRLPTRAGSDVPANLPAVFEQLRRDTSITVANPSRQIEQLFKIVSNVDQVFLALAAVVMLSSGIGIMLALYNSMEQRRRQIAVLRVLGASRSRVFGLILTESALLGLAGAVLGVVLALVGNELVAAVMKQRLGLVIQPNVSPEFTMMLILATTLLASAAGVVPGVMAYRTSVARNLKPIG
ncbi:MAG: ABC transporter permease [Phycisphaerales bacterium]